MDMTHHYLGPKGAKALAISLTVSVHWLLKDYIGNEVYLMIITENKGGWGCSQLVNFIIINNYYSSLSLL